jgi:Transposase DDE domain
VLPGNTADKTTLRGFLDRIERQYGKAGRVWLMDRGVPTEEVLPTGQARGLKAHEMRAADPPMHYLVGTPKGRLTRLEKHLIAQPWQQARPGVQVKLLAQEGELYVLAQSRDRVAKERAMRRRQLKRLWARLKQLSTMRLTREELLMKLGAARDQSRTAWRLVTIEIAAEDATFSYRLDRNKLRQTRLREGRYLLRTNLVEEDPTKLWSHYLLLMAVEEAFKNLKGDLAIRPVFHQLEARIEAHVFIAFLAYCLHVTLARRLHALAPGLTPRSVLEKFAAMQMIDVHLPTTDGRGLVLTRYTEPEAELRLLLQKLKLECPPNRPREAPPRRGRRPRCSADLRGSVPTNSNT